MATYIVLGNYTEQGIKNIKEGPSRLDAAKDLVRSVGGELRAFYLVMGTYDLVAIIEAPNDAAVAKVALELGAAGNVKTATLRAFDEAEYRDIVAGLD